MIAMLSGNRLYWLPPLLWETVFSFFRGSDMGKLLARRRLNRRGRSF